MKNIMESIMEHAGYKKPSDKINEAKKLTPEEARVKEQIDKLSASIRSIQARIRNDKKDLENTKYQAKKGTSIPYGMSATSPEDRKKLDDRIKKSKKYAKDYAVSARAEIKKLRDQKKALVDKFKKMRGSEN